VAARPIEPEYVFSQHSQERLPF
jgi:translation initiation factor IF-3